MSPLKAMQMYVLFAEDVPVYNLVSLFFSFWFQVEKQVSVTVPK